MSNHFQIVIVTNLQRTLFFIRYSCMKHNVFVTGWWPLVPVEQARAFVLTFSWRPWVTVVLPIVRCAWIQKPSLHRRCLEGLMWPPMTGLMAYSPLSGVRLSKQRKVCYLSTVADLRAFIVGHLASWVVTPVSLLSSIRTKNKLLIKTHGKLNEALF